MSRYSIRNDRNGELMTDALHFIYLELGRLGIRKDDDSRCVTNLQKMAYSLKYMHDLQAPPKGFDDEFQRLLYKAGELSGMTQQQRRQYDIAMTTKIDIIAQQDYARDCKNYFCFNHFQRSPQLDFLPNIRMPAL